MDERALAQIHGNLPSSTKEVLDRMHLCNQSGDQSVYEHGVSVWQHLRAILDYLAGDDTALSGWKVPTWLPTYREKLLANVHGRHLLETYTTYHDCGKPYCETADHHFPDHANVSRYIWKIIGGDSIIVHLMLHDMDIHTCNAVRIAQLLEKEWSEKDAVTLLLAALAEIHSNAAMFGGMDSQSFRIKWKRVSCRGMQICKRLFDQ